MKEKWILKPKKEDFRAIAARHGISPLLAKCIVNKGYTTEKEIQTYLYGTLDDLHSPWELYDMENAVKLLQVSKERGEKVAIASDFDCDGIFSSFVLHKGLERLGIYHEIFTPDRVKEGYGLNERIIAEAKDRGMNVVLTCDNGIAALDAIEYAKNNGMTVIVTDHHEVQGELPVADAIINPKREECQYPFKALCGAGVAFKLIQALYETFEIPKKELEDLLEYVAIATIADVMDLVEENRILVREGLKKLEHTKNVGIRELMKENGIWEKTLVPYHVGFILGPCFNAAGRLETVKMALDLLMEQDEKKAWQMACTLKELNESRKEMTNKGVLRAIEIVESTGIIHDSVLVIQLEDCHESLMGIVAGRIRERYHKPTIVLTKAEHGLKGSGRSIEAYHMFDKLYEQKELLLRFGGHPMAAGLSLEEENFELLRSSLNENAGLTEQDFIPVVSIDAAMSVGYLTEEMVQELSKLEPIGKGNEKPLLAEQHFHIRRAWKRGKNKNVLSCSLINSEGHSISGVYFGDIEAFDEFIISEYGVEELQNMYEGKQSQVDVAFTYYPEINEYNGVRSIQLKLQNYCRVKN